MRDFTIVIFGVTGDLSKRSIIPALYYLLKKERIKKFAVIGASLENKNIEEVFQSAKEFIKDFDKKVWDNLLSISSYCQLDLLNPDDYQNLKDLITQKETEFNLSSNRLFYCAVSAKFFIPTTQNLAKSGILKRDKDLSSQWNRIVYEKPFGIDLKSAQEINKAILQVVDESQIFRIDHYLSKEIVDNITFVRFTNRIFEPLWNNNNIDSVQIILDEKVSIEGRGKLYDSHGALKDVVQSHMLQLMSIVAMEPPKKLIGDYIRDCKSEILKKIEPVDGLLGQYTGYKNENDVNPNSKTETFAALKLKINDNRWNGVPFYLKTGKCLEKKQTKIVIKFKNAPCLLAQSCPMDPNYLTISIFPEEGIVVELFTKKPNTRDQIMSVKMDLCYSCLFSPETFQAYENIIMDILVGDKSISVREDEIEYSWKIIDKIIAMNLPLYEYQKESMGPIQSDEFALKNNFEWKDQ